MKKIIACLKSEKAASFFKHLSEWVISATVALVITAIIGTPIIAIPVLVGFSILSIVYLLVSNNVTPRWDIIKILESEMKAGNYTQTIRIGYPLSRPLHLSGRIGLRYKIGTIVKQACEKLLSSNVNEIEVNGKLLVVNTILASVLIDDLGWTAYELHKYEVSVDNIKAGVAIAENNNQYALALKGYRHLIGINDFLQNTNERDEAVEKGNQIIESEAFKKSIPAEKYEHIVAEYDYAIAKILIDSDPGKALEKAERVQKVFRSEKARDDDRYAKTFDLIGDIYSSYNSPQKLKKAKAVYLEGIKKCQEYGRSERLLRIATDYIVLLNKMITVPKQVYDKASWSTIDEEEADIYNQVYSNVSIDNRELKQQLSKEHKKYIKLRKKNK